MDAARLDWSDDEIDFHRVHPDDPVEYAQSQEMLRKQRSVLVESAQRDASQLRLRSEKTRLFRGDVKRETQRELPKIPLSIPLSSSLAASVAPTLPALSIPLSPQQAEAQDKETTQAFPAVAAHVIVKLSLAFLAALWSKYKEIVGNVTLSPVDDSLLSVSAFPALIRFVNQALSQSLQLKEIKMLSELEKDDYLEFSQFVDAIEPLLDVSQITNARKTIVLPSSPTNSIGTPRSARGRKRQGRTPPRRRSRPTSASSFSRPQSASSTPSRGSQSATSLDENLFVSKAATHRACCALPACLCRCQLPAALLMHMRIESEHKAREEVDLSNTDLHRIKVKFLNLLHEHRGQLRIKQVAPLLQELGIQCHANRLPQRVWDLYDSFFIDSFESLLTLITYLNAEDEKEKDPLSHLYRYPLPDWLRNEFKPAEILLFQHQFGLIDVDGGGSIDASELQQLLSAFDSPVSLDEAQAIVDKYDIDGNGTVDFVEFMILIYKIQRGSIDMLGNDLAEAVMEAKSQIRIFEEIEEVNLNPPELVEVGHFGGRVVVCQFRIYGPPGTVFANRVIPCQMTFREGYPYRPPDLLFHCRLFHINVENHLDGKAHLLHSSQVWGSDWSIVKLLTHIVDLLRTPAPSLLPKPYDELYDVLEKEYAKTHTNVTQTNVPETVAEGSIVSLSQSNVFENQQLSFGSVETNMPHSNHHSQSTLLSQIVKDKFQKLNRVQTMHLSVLFVYLFDQSAYSTLAATTGKSEDEMLMEQLENQDNESL